MLETSVKGYEGFSFYLNLLPRCRAKIVFFINFTLHVKGYYLLFPNKHLTVALLQYNFKYVGLYNVNIKPVVRNSKITYIHNVY